MKDSAKLNEGFLSNSCKSVCFRKRNLRAVALYSCDKVDNDDDDSNDVDDVHGDGADDTDDGR
jgi:hypothetical protein